MGRTRRASLLAAAALALAAWLPQSALAAEGDVTLTIYKAGFVVGASGGSGELVFEGKSYPLTVGGISLGLTIGASRADLSGKVHGITSAADIAGTYTQVDASAVAAGGGSIKRLTKGGGVSIDLQGRDVGLLASIDLSGIIIGLGKE